MDQANQQTRKKKVYYQYPNKSTKPVPMIRLNGKYLKEYGFEVGEYLNVQMEDGKITITRDEERMKELSEMRSRKKTLQRGYEI